LTKYFFPKREVLLCAQERESKQTAFGIFRIADYYYPVQIKFSECVSNHHPANFCNESFAFKSRSEPIAEFGAAIFPVNFVI
jgi:hypothetical protein